MVDVEQPQQRQGLKRKRNNVKGKQRQKAQKPKKEITVANRLNRAVQELSRAAKKACAFEIQKLVRKLKEDSTKKKVLEAHAREESEAILKALKALDHRTLSKDVLRARLVKDKNGLLELEDAVREFCEDAPHNLSTADPKSPEGKAWNKVLANKLFSDKLKEALATLKAIATGSTLGFRVASNPSKIEEAKGVGSDKSKSEKKAKLQSASNKIARDGEDTSSSEGSDIDTDEDDFDSEEEEDDATVSHISAEDEVSDDEEFEGFVDASRNPDSDFSGAEEDSDEEEPEGMIHEASSKKAKKNTRAEAVPTAPTSSAFLPSLAGGYTLGDSDGSVYSDSDNDGAGSAKPQRKNRRGQRARQAIWERKYGKNAKHVKRKNELAAATEENRKRTMAEKHIEALKKSGRYIPGADSNLTQLGEGKEKRTWAANPGTNVTESTATEAAEREKRKEQKKALEDKPLHPSWEARKKAKEVQAALNSKPAGKKIVFD